MSLKSFFAHFVLSVTGLFPVQSNSQQASQCRGYVTLNVFERVQFLQVSQSARPVVSAQYLAEPGCGRQMLDTLDKLGAEIEYSDEKSGFALVTIAREKLLSTLDVAGIEYAYTRDDDRMYYQDPDARIPQSERKPEPVPAIEIPYPRVATTLAKDGPYFAMDEIGLSDLWKLHPEADGRGVRVAVPDEGFDLLHPALQQARDADGNIVPKVADLGSLTTLAEDPGWVRFGATIDAYSGIFEAAGRTWIAPAPGRYRFGIFKQNLVLGPERNTHTKKLSLSVGVLWNQRSKQVWVDTDGDGSFKNQRALSDFAVKQDIDWFGAKVGDEDNRIPFGVKIEAARDAVYIRVGGDHGALVAGPLAGNMLTGGLFNGAAPSVQLVDSNNYRDTYLADMVAMFARQDVDIINRSGGIGRAGYTGLAEGIEDFEQHVLERCVEVYNKPFVAYSAAVGTIHVNDYTGPEMLRRNRQLAPPYRDTINSFVWDLPSGWLNTVLAPSANLETESRYDPLDILWPDGRRRSYAADSFYPPAPDGYVIGDNNSPTIPVISGVLADLISEAKREHVRYNVNRLNNAIFTGTRLLPGFSLSLQGYGLINAANSWNQLAKMATTDDPANTELTSFTISRMEAGKMVDVQGFQADLTTPGGKLDGEIWITRHGGFANGRKYTFALRGNDGRYELLDRESTLVRDKPVRVRFRSNDASGWNIVFLELRDAMADVVMQDVPLSVRAPDMPEEIAPGIDKYESNIAPLRNEDRYVEVRRNIQAARYTVRLPYTSSLVFFPGARSESKTPPHGESIDAMHHVGPMETVESLVPNDESRLQNVFWENRGRPEYSTPYDPPAPDVPIHAELTVTKYAVRIERNGDKLDLMNEQAPIDGRAELYDATLKRQSLTGAGLHAMGEIEQSLSDHLAEWRVQVTSSAPLEEPADVYVFNCVSKNACFVAAQQEISAASRALVIENPPAGAWKIAVRSRNQVQNPVTYMIREALLVSAATPIEAADSKHSNRASWTLPLPETKGDAQYAAFRIAGTPSDEGEKNGLVIAMTPLDENAP